MNPPSATAEEIFRRLLDESSSLLASPETAGIAIPDDELHREIIVPLLPAMLADVAIRRHWSEQAATGFVARLARHFECGDPAPRWTAGDFEIHVTASYSAAPDARALADTLLSEDSLREMTAALMNLLLDVMQPMLVPGPAAEPAGEVVPPSGPVETPEPPKIPKIETWPSPMTETPEFDQTPPAASPHFQPSFSRALVRTLCRRIPVPVVRRKLAADAACGANASIIAGRILRRAKLSRRKS